MTMTADHGHNPTSSRSDESARVVRVATGDALPATVPDANQQFVHRSHYMEDDVCLHCGAYDRRLYDPCLGRMGMD